MASVALPDHFRPFQEGLTSCRPGSDRVANWSLSDRSSMPIVGPVKLTNDGSRSGQLSELWGAKLHQVGPLSGARTEKKAILATFSIGFQFPLLNLTVPSQLNAKSFLDSYATVTPCAQHSSIDGRYDGLHPIVHSPQILPDGVLLIQTAGSTDDHVECRTDSVSVVERGAVPGACSTQFGGERHLLTRKPRANWAKSSTHPNIQHSHRNRNNFGCPKQPVAKVRGREKRGQPANFLSTKR